MKIGEVLAREVMGKDFIEPERVSVPERRKAAKITHGFDPRKMVSTVSYTCSACNKHCGRDDKECPYCHAEFVDHIWNPPTDIKEALDKQRPHSADDTSQNGRSGPCLVQVDELSETERGAKGFGSTGK